MGKAVHVPDWLPDPHDLSHYPDPKTAPLARWSWEFLRRNLNYQLTYTDLTERAAQLNITLAVALGLPRHIWNRILSSPTADADKPLLALVSDYWRATDKFRIRFLDDPASEFNVDHERMFAVDAVHMWRADLMGFELDWRDFATPTLLVALDLSRPWTQQAEAVCSAFEKAQKAWLESNPMQAIDKERNVAPYLWLNYLRVLDAVERGETRESIAAWLLPKGQRNKLTSAGKSITKMWKQAQEWRDLKYRQICAPRRG